MEQKGSKDSLETFRASNKVQSKAVKRYPDVMLLYFCGLSVQIHMN